MALLRQLKPFYLHLQSQRQVLNHCTWETDNEVEKVVDLVDSKEEIVSIVTRSLSLLCKKKKNKI